MKIEKDRGINLHIMDGRNPAPVTIGNMNVTNRIATG
jgi:hypothetical protein